MENQQVFVSLSKHTALKTNGTFHTLEKSSIEG